MLAELEDIGVAVYHHGTPISSACFTIDGASYNYNKFDNTPVRFELIHDLKEPYNKSNRQNNNSAVSEVAASNMTTIKQECEANGITTMKPYIDYSLQVAQQIMSKLSGGRISG